MGAIRCGLISGLKGILLGQEISTSNMNQINVRRVVRWGQLQARKRREKRAERVRRGAEA